MRSSSGCLSVKLEKKKLSDRVAGLGWAELRLVAKVTVAQRVLIGHWRVCVCE